MRYSTLIELLSRAKDASGMTDPDLEIQVGPAIANSAKVVVRHTQYIAVPARMDPTDPTKITSDTLGVTDKTLRIEGM
jgi:hypothetical protein